MTPADFRQALDLLTTAEQYTRDAADLPTRQVHRRIELALRLLRGATEADVAAIGEVA